MTSPEGVDAIRRAKGTRSNTLSLPLLLGIGLKRVFGVYSGCQAKLTPHAETLKDGSLMLATHRLLKNFSRGDILEDATERLRKELIEETRESVYPESVMLWSFLRQRLARATSNAIWGCNFGPGFIESLGDFEGAMEKLTLPLSSIFAGRERQMHEKLVARMPQYFQGRLYRSKFGKQYVAMCEQEDL